MNQQTQTHDDPLLVPSLSERYSSLPKNAEIAVMGLPELAHHVNALVERAVNVNFHDGADMNRFLSSAALRFARVITTS